MTLDLAGRIALVTGSSGGIGLAIARQLGRHSARVVVNSRDRARAAAATLRREGVQAIAIAADVSRPAAAQRLVAATKREFGRIDIQVNNAGVNAIFPAETFPADEWTRVLKTNPFAVFYCSQAAGSVMLEQGSGMIINIGSAAGKVAMPNRVAYVTAKHGIEGLAKALAIEWGRRGVRVVAIDPGYVRTGMVARSQAQAGFNDSAIVQRSPGPKGRSRAKVVSLGRSLWAVISGCSSPTQRREQYW